MHLIDTLASVAGAPVKTEATLIRMSPKEKKVLQKAADLARRKLADYVRVAALERAETDLAAAQQSNDEK